MFLIECGLTLLALVVTIVFAPAELQYFKTIEVGFGRLARRRTLSVVVVGVSALALRAALLPILPMPEPIVHDEFSHLLLADTLAHGRLANPTHPMWIHFETFHVNQKPTYASMYYPAQALFLAAGQVVFGYPFWGVWLSIGLMCAAICWMLQGWLPPIWALLGGMVAVIRIGSFSYWANSYWGGAVPALGGALVLGALPRIKRRPQTGYALLMGLGFSLLASSRPFESLFFCLPIGIAGTIHLLEKKGSAFQLSLRRTVLPAAAVTAVAAGAMGYYFWRVTGNPFRVPYQVNIDTNRLLYFPWQSLTPAAKYHHLVIQKFYLGDAVLGQYERARAHPVELLLVKFVTLWPFFLGPVLTLSLLILPSVLPYGTTIKDIPPKAQFMLLICGATGIALALPVYIPEAHYAAACTSAIYVLVLMAMQRVRRWRRKKETGLTLVRAVPCICVLLLVVRVTTSLAHAALPEPFPHSWCWPPTPLQGRSAVLKTLTEYPGRHLIIVRYKPDHDPTLEWVYNGADIDKSKVVWARDMGKERNQELTKYFSNRQVWLVEPDETPLKLATY